MHLHPLLQRSNRHLDQPSCHLPLPAVGDKEAWLAASACCLPLLPPTKVPEDVPAPGLLGLVMTWVLSLAQGPSSPLLTQPTIGLVKEDMRAIQACPT